MGMGFGSVIESITNITVYLGIIFIIIISIIYVRKRLNDTDEKLESMFDLLQTLTGEVKNLKMVKRVNDTNSSPFVGLSSMNNYEENNTGNISSDFYKEITLDNDNDNVDDVDTYNENVENQYVEEEQEDEEEDGEEEDEEEEEEEQENEDEEEDEEEEKCCDGGECCETKECCEQEECCETNGCCEKEVEEEVHEVPEQEKVKSLNVLEELSKGVLKSPKQENEENNKDDHNDIKVVDINNENIEKIESYEYD